MGGSVGGIAEGMALEPTLGSQGEQHTARLGGEAGGERGVFRKPHGPTVPAMVERRVLTLADHRTVDAGVGEGRRALHRRCTAVVGGLAVLAEVDALDLLAR